MGSLIAPKGQTEFERQLVSTGLQEVVCYSVIDLGTQEVKWEGETKLQRKVQITFETEEKGLFTDKETGEQVEKPLIIGNRYTLSMHEKSGLYKVLKGWIGKAPSEDFDISTLVGKPAIVNVIETEGKDGKVYHNIDTILPSKKDPFKLYYEEVRFSLQNYEESEFSKIPEWMQKIIHKSVEMKDIKQPKEDLSMPF